MTVTAKGGRPDGNRAANGSESSTEHEQAKADRSDEGFSGRKSKVGILAA